MSCKPHSASSATSGRHGGFAEIDKYALPDLEGALVTEALYISNIVNVFSAKDLLRITRSSPITCDVVVRRRRSTVYPAVAPVASRGYRRSTPTDITTPDGVD